MKVSNVRGYGLAILSSLAVAYYSLLNQSWFALGGVAVCLIAGVVYAAKHSSSTDLILNNVLLCMAFATAGVLVVAIPALKAAWRPRAFAILAVSMVSKLGVLITVLVAGIACSYVIAKMLKVSVAQAKPGQRAIGMVLSRLVFFGSIAYFFMAGMPDWSWQGRGVTWILQNLLVLFVFGLDVYRQFRVGGKANSCTSTSRVTYVMLMVSIVLPTLFPTFNFGGNSVRALLNDIVLSWPALVVGTVAVVVWMALLYSALDEEQQADAASVDLLVVVALLGTAWLLKFVLMNPVIGSPALVLVFWYAAIRFAVQADDPGIMEDVPALYSLFLWQGCKILVVLVVLIAALAFVNAGYFWFVVVVTAGVVLARQVGSFGTWLSQGAFWQIVVIAMAAAAWSISSQRALLSDKTLLIVAIAVFASVALWMMVWHNEVGFNGYFGTKIAMGAVLAIMLLLVSFNGAVSATLKGDERMLAMGGGKVSLVVKDPSTVRSVRYMWSDSPITIKEKAKIIKLGGKGKDSVDFNQSKRHLTVWLDATNGVTTRIDRWYPANGGIF